MAPDIPATLAHIRGLLAAAADPKFRDGQGAYFKHEVDTWGVRSIALNRIESELFHRTREWPEEARDQLCAELWKSGKLEEGALVCHVTRRFPLRYPRPRFVVFEEWIDRYVNNWVHCDGVASWLIAGCVAEEPRLERALERWTASSNRWKRRAAAVALIQEAKAGRLTNEIFRIASMLADDPDDMVQKGVGWLLKEAYPKHPKDVVLFVHRQRERLSRVALRYAAEKMTPEHRNVVLYPGRVANK